MMWTNFRDLNTKPHGNVVMTSTERLSNIQMTCSFLFLDITSWCYT